MVHGDGVIATNAHVLHAFRTLPAPPDALKDDWPVCCVLLKLIDKGMIEIPLEILAAVHIRQKYATGSSLLWPRRPGRT